MIFLILAVFCGIFLLLYIPIPWVYGRVLRKIQRIKAVSGNQVFLTFDDGPGNRLTPQILAVLNDNNVKATFFVLGRNVVGRERILKSIVKQGHSVASHSFSHLHAWQVLPWRLISDIKKGWECLYNVFKAENGKYVFRPPCGKLNLLSVLFLWWHKVRIVYWTIDSLDTWAKDKRNPKHAAERIRSDGGGIVLFHDFDRATDRTDDYVLDSLKAVIKAGQEMQLTFLSIDRLYRK